MENRKITFPDQTTMLARLLQVSRDANLQKHFYPTLLQCAGKESFSHNAALVLMEAIDHYKEVMNMTGTQAQQMVARQGENFLDAIITDPDLAKEAENFLRECISG